MKLSDLLIEAKAAIADPDHWTKSGWTDGYFVEDLVDLLNASKVCAVTSLARTCVKNGETGLQFSNSHDCDCPHCTVSEEPRELEDVMGDFEHPSRLLLDRAAEELYDDHDMIHVNDSINYNHADVLRCYDRAIELALAEEAATA